jgi:8-oxo-dGTP pyrophosphatase MutT (NUDIX family)
MSRPVAPMIKIVPKAFAYITIHGHLLVFEQLGCPRAGLQVPAGTLEPGEDPAAALREAEEETGLFGFDDVVPLGVRDFDARLFGKREIHRRHFFHLPFSKAVGEVWRHEERYSPRGAHRPITFELSWLPLSSARTALSFDHGALVDAIWPRLAESARLA